MEVPRPTRLGARTWSAFVILGLAGQLAWTVENMYLNVFVYDTITDNPTVIATLVGASAIVATLTALVVGAWSDRTGNRRTIVTAGYVLWGATTAAFGFATPESVGSLIPGWDAVTAAIAVIIVLDCVMTFFGSSANDAAYQAWVTDSTDPSNRGRVDGVLATLPLLSMLLVFAALDGLTQAGEWRLFFGIVGAFTAVVGVIAWFTVRNRPPAARGTSVWADIVFMLRPSTLRAHPRLYQVLVAVAIIGVASQVYFPYLIIYIQRTLRIDGYAIVLGVVLTTASLFSILGGRLADRIGKLRMVLPAMGVLVLGLLGMFVVRDMIGAIIAGTVMMTGFLVSTSALAATVRDLVPEGRAGSVQGVRMIAVVLIPMVIGPWIGAFVIQGADETYLDLGVEKQVPTSWIFVAAAAVVLIAVPLMLRLLRADRGAGRAVAEAPVADAADSEAEVP
ncbi:MFS transporter [Salinibacterium sp. ZJ70]|uniref:MFS transporter n=1 Tax=Salinibacterium sp. ZJ70 TaxID=2708084 RepID=UPI001CD2728A|nr:MFS transporter [Salinibacterium sp. ZJ70]